MSVLTRLFIQNYAIIDEIEIRFGNGFHAITGETGAGKSIIIGALGLILGQRADSSVLVYKDKKLVVEGSFVKPNQKNVQTFLAAHELEDEEELVLRREIATNGKSRAFINDSPVNLSQLQELSAMLVDLHQQFDTLELGNVAFQREVLDALAGQFNVLALYQESYARLLKERHLLLEMQQAKQRVDAEADYNRFQLQELEEAGYKPGELEELDQELKLLSNAEGIRTMLMRTTGKLSGGEEPLLAQLKQILNEISHYRTLLQPLPVLEDRIRSAYLELQDLSSELERLSDSVSIDPTRLAYIQDRLSTGYRLCKKHQVTTTDELLYVQAMLAEKLKAAQNMDHAISTKEKLTQELEKETTQQAAQLSAGRKKQIAPLTNKVNELLHRVGMPTAVLSVSLENKPMGPDGSDSIEFLFDANKSGQFQPLRKVASGGELSRLMLCIKSLIASSVNLSTMIFDEIDTGIAGEAARQVGILLKELSNKRQVICITHQPQIAGKADFHYFVFKEPGNQTAIKTGIRQLDSAERITIIAQMLGGENPSKAALANAREMIS